MESHGVDTSAQPPALSNQRWQRRQQQQQQQHAEQKNGKARKFVDCVAHPLADEKRGILSSWMCLSSLFFWV